MGLRHTNLRFALSTKKESRVVEKRFLGMHPKNLFVGASTNFIWGQPGAERANMGVSS